MLSRLFTYYFWHVFTSIVTRDAFMIKFFVRYSILQIVFEDQFCCSTHTMLKWPCFLLGFFNLSKSIKLIIVNNVFYIISIATLWIFRYLNCNKTPFYCSSGNSMIYCILCKDGKKITKVCGALALGHMVKDRDKGEKQ